MKSIKELSEQLGVSKSYIRKKAEESGIKEKMVMDGNVLRFTPEQETQICEMIAHRAPDAEPNVPPKDDSIPEEPSGTASDALSSQLLSMLREELERKNQELEEKNRQIEKLHAHLQDCHRLLDQQQQLSLLSEKRALAPPKKRLRDRLGRKKSDPSQNEN